MSYDVYLLHPVTKKPIIFDYPHQIRGGTYELGGTRQAHLNIMYSYGDILRRVLDPEKGIRKLYGMTGAESLPLLNDAIAHLSHDVDDDYWKPTEGNVKSALYQLKAFATMRPDGIWNGD